MCGLMFDDGSRRCGARKHATPEGPSLPTALIVNGKTQKQSTHLPTRQSVRRSLNGLVGTVVLGVCEREC